ncbi:BTB/POZ protein [Rhizophagus irregularis DAOM 181602=DAOM 197198]|nr:BTB/POZ protein [Rhizophagus irregularis DAOM 181602=DAOM 197198]
MSIEFYTKLSQNYIELLKDDEYYDITIEVVHIRLPDISSEIFQIILEYIYGGILSLNVNDASDFIKVLAAADELHLQELVDYLQNYLIENESEWMEQHFGFTQQIINETEEILGGYNPLEWETTNSWGKTEDSFIFSFKDKNVKNATLSNVIDANRALDYSSTCGPKFGSDLNIFTCTNRNNRSNDVSKVFNVTYCKKVRYERNIRDTEDYFSIEDYEVFQIIRR